MVKWELMAEISTRGTVVELLDVVLDMLLDRDLTDRVPFAKYCEMLIY